MLIESIFGIFRWLFRLVGDIFGESIKEFFSAIKQTRFGRVFLFLCGFTSFSWFMLVCIKIISFLMAHGIISDPNFISVFRNFSNLAQIFFEKIYLSSFNQILNGLVFLTGSMFVIELGRYFKIKFMD